MNVLNRREFLSVFAGAGAISLAVPTLASTSTTDKAGADVTSLYVKGLVMVDLSNPDVIRLGFPKAPGHKATLSVLSETGAPKVMTIKGKGTITGTGTGNAKVVAPELIRIKELYGNEVKGHVDQCPGVITISRNAVKSITTAEVTPSRYTFVRSDNGEEVATFRPRQVADVIRMDLSSVGNLKLDDGKVDIPLQTARELRVEYTVERSNSADPLADHFHHYFPYVERPAALDFDVVPRKVGASAATAPSPHVGHQFMMLDNYAFCSLLAVE